MGFTRFLIKNLARNFFDNYAKKRKPDRNQTFFFVLLMFSLKTKSIYNRETLKNILTKKHNCIIRFLCVLSFFPKPLIYL